MPEHLMARLKQLEASRDPSTAKQLNEPISATALPPGPTQANRSGKTTKPRRPNVAAGSEEESLYVAFGQLLLEDDDAS